MVRHIEIGPTVPKLGLIEVFKALGLKMAWFGLVWYGMVWYGGLVKGIKKA